MSLALPLMTVSGKVAHFKVTFSWVLLLASNACVFSVLAKGSPVNGETVHVCHGAVLAETFLFPDKRLEPCTSSCARDVELSLSLKQ